MAPRGIRRKFRCGLPAPRAAARPGRMGTFLVPTRMMRLGEKVGADHVPTLHSSGPGTGKQRLTARHTKHARENQIVFGNFGDHDAIHGIRELDSGVVEEKLGRGEFHGS